jgi:type IV pilus assembly protein PilZ
VARLKLHLVERGDFTKYQDPSAGPQGLFVPSGDPPAVGSRVTVEVIFQKGPRVLLNGLTAWRRAAGDARARPGSGVNIDAGEKSKMNYIIGYVRGGLQDVREKRRLPVRLRVAYTSARGRRVNFTRDINEEGAFVRTAELLEVGSRTQLLISPPGGEYKPIEVHGTVARAQLEGDRGVGVKFEFTSDLQRNMLKAFVAKLETDYLDGRLPDDVLI